MARGVLSRRLQSRQADDEDCHTSNPRYCLHPAHLLQSLHLSASFSLTCTKKCAPSPCGCPALVSSLLHTCFPMLPCPAPHLQTAPWLEAPTLCAHAPGGPQVLTSPHPAPTFSISLSLPIACPRLQTHTCSPRVRSKVSSLEPAQRLMCLLSSLLVCLLQVLGVDIRCGCCARAALTILALCLEQAGLTKSWKGLLGC